MTDTGSGLVCECRGSWATSATSMSTEHIAIVLNRFLIFASWAAKRSVNMYLCFCLACGKTHLKRKGPLYDGWELSCDARCGLRLQLRFCCWLMKPQNRLALDSNCTLSLQNTQRGAPSGLATGYTVVPNCKVFCCEHICSNWRTYSKWEIVLWGNSINRVRLLLKAL